MTIDLGIDGIGPATRLGSGGFGTVYSAEQFGMSRQVAVKVLASVADDPDARRRFERERQALGKMSDHPNIVSVFDWGITREGRPYLVMELLPGGTLGRLVAERGPLSVDTTAAVGLAVASALVAAHERGVFHRDVKPENILISGYGRPVLCDFGISRLVGASRTTAGAMTGSLAHAAPEVINGEEVGAATDVWALGSTLATLLLGKPPFVLSADESMTATIARILTRDPPDLADHGVPPELAAVLQRAMTRDPAIRTATAASFAEGLSDAIRANGWNPTPLLPVLQQASEQGSVESFYDKPTIRQEPVGPHPGQGRADYSAPAVGIGETKRIEPSLVASGPPKTVAKGPKTPWAIAAVAILVAVAAVGVVIGITSRKSSNNAGATAGPTTVAPTIVPTTASPPTTQFLSPTAPATGGTSATDGVVNSWIARMAATAVSAGTTQRDSTLASVREQIPQAQVLFSDDYASLTPGYWIVYYPRPFPNGAAAISFCDSVGRTTNHDCYGSFLSHSVLDKTRVCLRNTDGSLPADCET